MSSPILDWPRLGRMVADHLPGPWDAAPGTFDETVALVHPDGRRILLQTDRTGHRIVATGTLPPEAERGVRLQRHEISVSTDRGPAVFAREIARRLLPAYTTDLTTAQNHLRERNRRAEQRADRVELLLAALPGDPVVPGHENNDDRTGVSWYGERGRSSRIVLYGDGSTGDLELGGLAFRTVQEICALLVRYEGLAAPSSSEKPA
ncbi:hypothetical protein BJF79_07280 [Actinomadura sp. CNU-125]|uniref:hypothetical protein n=1 Tax=Actinomadura sp. CNU-125 TaxID=1904961 RepID=UPI000968D5D2|nr:hypothetical protein [Actinomadura sp. CNU-125]OLT34365.1 hypothetical protein BJF79_07280 [Actinomadura sp. CNU-125]